MAAKQEQRDLNGRKNYDAIKRKFMVWLATPELERLPVTQGLFANEYGVNQNTLCDWKNKPEFMAKVNELVDKHLSDDYGDAVDTMKREMRKGSFQHLKLYFEMIGKYVPKFAPTTPDGKRPYAGYTSDDINREIAELIEQADLRAVRRPRGRESDPQG